MNRHGVADLMVKLNAEKSPMDTDEHRFAIGFGFTLWMRLMVGTAC